MAAAGLCRRHRHVRLRGLGEAAVAEPGRMGSDLRPEHRHAPERRTGGLLHRTGIRTAAAGGRRMSAAAEAEPTDARRDERHAIRVACGAHALHDGYTDLIYVMLPIWQAEFGLSYAAIGLLRGTLAGAMASFQIPA